MRRFYQLFLYWKVMGPCMGVRGWPCVGSRAWLVCVALVGLVWVSVVGLVWVAVVGLVWVAVVGLVWMAVVGLVWVAVVDLVWMALVATFRRRRHTETINPAALNSFAILHPSHYTLWSPRATCRLDPTRPSYGDQSSGCLPRPDGFLAPIGRCLSWRDGFSTPVSWQPRVNRHHQFHEEESSS